MKQTKFVKPATGLIVRDPVTMTPLPEGGANVEWNSYWRRRLTDGSIVIPEPQSKPAAPSKTMSQSDDGDRKEKEKGGSRS